MPDEQRIDFSTVTEVTGAPVTKEQIERMATRYRFASRYCEGKDVLEVACGSGQGLGALSEVAKSVVGGDYDEGLVRRAKEHYGERIEVRVLDAHDLPFDDDGFDVVILYEAIYYLKEPARFIAEALRVLREGGVIIIGTVNKSWAGFNPSPYSHSYLSAPELHALLSEGGFRDVELFADCPAVDRSLKGKIVAAIKLVAVRLDLIPNTMKSKELLKRIFLGKLTPLPQEIEVSENVSADLTAIPHDQQEREHKVLFAVGHV